MKIRVGFVANSSSYSSIVAIGIVKKENIEKFKKMISIFNSLLGNENDLFRLYNKAEIKENYRCRINDDIFYLSSEDCDEQYQIINFKNCLDLSKVGEEDLIVTVDGDVEEMESIISKILSSDNGVTNTLSYSVCGYSG